VTKRLSVHLGTLGSGVAVGLTLRFLQGAILARWLGISEFGKLATIATVMAIVSRINDLGLPSAVAYFFRREPGTYGSLRRVIFADFAWCVVVSGALALVAPHLPFAFATDLRDSPAHRLLLAAYLAVNTPTWIFPSFVSAAGEYASYVRLTNTDAGLQAVFAIAACALFGPSALHVVGALTAEQILMSAVYLRFLRRYAHLAPPAPLTLGQTLSYGLRLQWGVVMKIVSSRADILTVSALTGQAQAGLYAIALNIRDIGLLPQSVYAAPFQNLIIDLAKRGETSDRLPIVTGLALQVWLSLAMIIAAAIALPFLIPLVYGAGFALAVIPAVVVFISTLFLGPAGMMWMIFNSKGRPHLTSGLLTAGGILGPAVTYVLLSRGYHLTGIAAGSVATSALTFALCLTMLQRLQHYRTADVKSGVARAGLLLASATRWIRNHTPRLSRDS
jgi:O-antigen/teichoic acid export membrane protein